VIKGWIQTQGLRAQLKAQSLVTGKLYVDLAFHPDTPIKMMGLDPKTPEIPAIPTALEEIEDTVRNFVKRVEKMPLEEIASNVNSALAAADELLRDPKLKDSIANLDGTLQETRKLLARLNSGFDDLSDDLRGTLEQATKTLGDADAAIVDVRSLIEPGSPFNYEVLVVLDEFSQTLRSIRTLSDSLARDPNQIIFGREKPGGQQ